MKIVDIELAGNEHGELRADTIHAKLVDGDGGIVIMATLEYVLAAIRNRNYEVEGVTVERKEQRGAMCSFVRLTNYGVPK